MRDKRFVNLQQKLFVMIGAIIAILIVSFIGTIIFGAIFTYNDKKLDEKSGRTMFVIVYILHVVVLLIIWYFVKK